MDFLLKDSPTRGISPLADKLATEGNSTLRGVRKWCILRLLSAKFTPMATFIKRGSKWKAEICCKGIRRAKSFPVKQQAIAWAHQQESEILAGDRGEVPNIPFSEALTRYSEKVSAFKKGRKWEQVRLDALKRDRIASVSMRALDNTHAADWRDRRLLVVSGESVRREKNLLSHVCTICIKEWGWLKKNPFHGLRMPPKGKHRDRLASEEELERLRESAVTDWHREALRAWNFAAETGMRASELLGLKEINGQVAVLTDTKNGERRDVPLSLKALELWDNKPFWLTTKQLDVHWRNLCKLAGVKDLHFHDSRHLAATRLSKKLNVLQLCKMFGWKDPRHAMIYFNESAEDVAKLL